MKKTIILLMAVSIILTSCGKSAELSDRDKRADKNTPPPASSAFKGNLLQITDDKDNVKQSSTDYAKDRKTAIGFISFVVIVIIVIAVGSFSLYSSRLEALY